MSKSTKAAKPKTESEYSAELRSLSIEQHVEAFLSAGGKIQKIPRGVSGQTQTSGPRHISLGNKSKN